MEERLSKTKNSGVLRKRGEIELRAKFCSIDIFGGKSNSAEAVRAARAAAVGRKGFSKFPVSVLYFGLSLSAAE